MKNANSRKRVSFGSKGSMVETWVIDDQIPTAKTNTENQFYHNIVANKQTRNDIVIPMTIHVIDKEEAQRGGWPIRRSASLESRDNPFLPGSPLAKETDDLLKRATIIRDKFYLDKDGNRVETPASPNGLREKGDQLADNAKAVEEEVVASVQQEVNQAAAPTSPSKENGKVNELLKPESVKLDLNEKDQALDGNITDKPSSPKNKKKEKNKCCTIM